MMVSLAAYKEIEVKVYVNDLKQIEEALLDLGATLMQPRTHEYNLRFDTPSGDLTQGSRVLRLRRDQGSHLTYKGPSTTLGGVLARQELEFEVSSFDQARKLIEALGYRTTFVYEKFRTTYDLDGLKITLDEMPYGNFLEIEGPSAEAIQDTARRIGLDWDKALPETYISLFSRLKELSIFSFRDLTFDNFEDQEVKWERLGVEAADLQTSFE